MVDVTFGTLQEYVPSEAFTILAIFINELPPLVEYCSRTKLILEVLAQVILYVPLASSISPPFGVVRATLPILNDELLIDEMFVLSSLTNLINICAELNAPGIFHEYVPSDAVTLVAMLVQFVPLSVLY